MATYVELFDLRANDLLNRRVGVACMVASDGIRTEAAATPNHDARIKWAGEVLRDPQRMGAQMFLAVLAQNKDLSVAQITGATDAALQNAVTAAVDLCALSLP